MGYNNLMFIDHDIYEGHRSGLPWLFFQDGGKATFIEADTALDANTGVNGIGLLNGAANGCYRADPCAQTATDTFFFVDNEIEQILHVRVGHILSLM